MSTKEAGHRAASDAAQLGFATEQGRVILTFNVRNFVGLTHEWSKISRPHAGIIVSDQLPFRELLRRILLLLQRHAHDDLTNRLLWLQDYKTLLTS